MLLQTSNRQWHMACQRALFPVTLSNLQDYLYRSGFCSYSFSRWQ